MQTLDILDIEEQTIDIDEACALEIKEYLALLALIMEIYEIKYSKDVIEKQYRHLTDVKKCEDTAFRFGKITGKYVIYRGETKDVDGIKYVNAEEYLKSFK